MNIVVTESHTKFPNTKVAFCKIPPQFNNNGDTENSKIAQLNEEMKLLDVEFIDVKSTEASLFTRDGKHYNKQGLAVLAGALIPWEGKMDTLPLRHDLNNSHRTQDENVPTLG